MKSALLPALVPALLALAAAAPAAAQVGALGAPGDGPLDISANDLEVFDQENRVVYSGDVNAIRGTARLRADRIEVFFLPGGGTGFGAVQRMRATGDVFYVTATEIARADEGIYEIADERIVLTGDVVLTQGCNVSTGQRLTANLATGVSELAGATGQAGETRVRSVFFPDGEEEEGAEPVVREDCPVPEIPGDGPQPFEDG